MTRTEICIRNARFFPEDSQWAKHCARVATYLNSIPPVTSKLGWDARDDHHQDYLAASKPGEEK